ncbi:MAG: cytochrome c, partial [Gammaproteobacteria bacterium]|nr:cytochrome c [Gammaproteobacteria bacterium]
MARRSAAVALALFAACGDSNVPLDRIDSETGRWYTAELAAAGSAVFARHCAECHGDAAQGTADDWR